ncbi:helix-hairpin-helix domain-containing protein [Demequina soli]|uniref:helix-hairpin-helix domain-containing protein n=1 Tax=Demequina soli TaxID=1638987 RepID=UPI00078078D9|nr:helix-hairpin-helix domain-containing protein [Demequina soli]
MDSSEDVRARWADGLRDAAARAYAAGHGADPPEPRPTRWRLDGRTAATAAVVVVLIAGVAWWGLRAEPEASLLASASPSPSGSVVGPAAATTVVVHVSGAVVHPGLVSLEPGKRVADAIELAGGLAEGADEASVNLARPVTDGEHIVVARVGEETQGGGAVDLNAADAAALDALPGIGPALAARIVADREANGPFATVKDLERVSGIGPAVVEAIADLATT